MPLLWLSIAFLAGTLLSGVLQLPWLVYASAAAGVLFILVEHFFLKNNPVCLKLRAFLRFPAGLLLILLALGGLRYLAGQPELSPSALAYYNDRGSYTITARVSAPPDRREDAVYLELTAFEIEDLRATDPLQVVIRVKGKARARFLPGVDWQMGDVLRFHAELRTPADDAYFSYKDYLERQYIGSVIYFPQQVKLVGVDRSAWLGRALDTLRERVRHVLFTQYPQPESGLLAGILLGLDQDLPSSLERAYQQTGTAHIIAISGFNMAVLAFLFMWFFNRVFNRYWAAGLSALLITLYAVFVGGMPSVVRAAVMAVSAFGGHLIGRRQSGLNALAVTAGVMCLVNPYLPWDASFQLSFAATLGLVFFAEPLRRWVVNLLQSRLPEENALRAAEPISEYFLYTLAAQLVTLPVIAWHFGRISLSSLLANPLVLPAQPPLLVLSGLSAVAGAILPAAGKALAFIAWPLAAYSNRVVALLARLDAASLAVNRSSALWLFAFVLVFILLFIFRNYFKKIFKGTSYWLLFLLALACFSVWSMVLHRPDGRLHFSLMRAGDEAALALRTPAGRTLVFNPGNNVNELSAAIGHTLSPWHYRIDEVWLTGSGSKRSLSLLEERIPLGSVVLAPVTYQAGADRAPYSVPQGIEIVKLNSDAGVSYSQELEIRLLAESASSSALLITHGRVMALIPGGVDYALIKETAPEALQGLTLIVLGEEDISYIPPRVWQALEPDAILWNSPSVCPVEGWLSLEGGDLVELVSDGEILTQEK